MDRDLHNLPAYAPAVRPFELDEAPDSAECTECGGAGYSMGFLGNLQWFRCRHCGMEFSVEVPAGA